MDRETLLQRLGYLYQQSTVDAVREELDRAADRGDARWERQIIERYQRRMGDISIFMKELKQRFGRRGQGPKFVLDALRDAASSKKGSENGRRVQ
jgi:hypothetical protein